MRAMRAEAFGGYQDLKFTDIPSPALSDGRVLVRMTAAGASRPSITRFSLANIRKLKRLWCLGTKGPASLKGAAIGQVRGVEDDCRASQFETGRARRRQDVPA